MRIVLNANVVIAAFAARGLCESIMEVCLSEHDIVLSDDLLDEILKNLRRKINLPPDLVDSIGALLRGHSTISIPVELAPHVCPDPDDIKILGLAIASGADCLVTGDKDLLILKSFKGVQIVNPRSFPDILHGRHK